MPMALIFPASRWEARAHKKGLDLNLTVRPDEIEVPEGVPKPDIPPMFADMVLGLSCLVTDPAQLRQLAAHCTEAAEALEARQRSLDLESGRMTEEDINRMAEEENGTEG